MVPNGLLSVLIIAQPGLLRDSILTIIKTLNFVKAIGALSIDNRLVSGIDHYHPDIVLMDCSTNQYPLKSVPEIKGRNLGCTIIAIVENPNHIKPAIQFGVDEVLVSGYTRQDLFTIIQDVSIRNGCG